MLTAHIAYSQPRIKAPNATKLQQRCLPTQASDPLEMKRADSNYLQFTGKFVPCIDLCSEYPGSDCAGMRVRGKTNVNRGGVFTRLKI